MTDLTHIHVCRFISHAHESLIGDCVCLCGAVYHVLGWREIKTSVPPASAMVPCAVHTEPGPFDVEEYRRDLTRRRDGLQEEIRVITRETTYELRDNLRIDRLVNKIKGIDIALSLLPKETL